MFLTYCILNVKDISYVVLIVSNDDFYDRDGDSSHPRVYEGWKGQESLKGTNPQSVAFDPLNEIVHTVVFLVTACGKPMTVARLGVILEKMLSPVQTSCLLQLVL